VAAVINLLKTRFYL